MFIDGLPVTESEKAALDEFIWEYMIATNDDPADLIEHVRGKAVIHVRHRAAHVLGLPLDKDHTDDGGLFCASNRRTDLELLTSEQIGPLP